MGTWGIARDMAKLNEENLSKLSRKRMFTRLKEQSQNPKGKVYLFKKASKEQIKLIRENTLKEESETKLRTAKISLLIFIPILFTIVYFLFLF